MFYYLRLDENFTIIERCFSGQELRGYIKVSNKEMEESYKYKKFNKEIRGFYELREKQEVKDSNKIEQIEQAVGILAEQVAKNTLLTGGNE